MKLNLQRVLALVSLVCAVASAACAQYVEKHEGSEAERPDVGFDALKVVADIPMPGSASRFDYQSFDPTTGLLYFSHMGANSIVVFDTRSRKVVANMPGYHRVTGVLAVPSIHRLFASVGGDGAIATIDTTNLHEINRVKPAKFTDGLAYEPSTNRVFVTDESGGADFVIDAASGRLIKRIDLGGDDVGNTQYNPLTRTIWVTVGARREIAEISPQSLSVVNRYPLAGADTPHGLYIDAPRKLAYVAYEGNNKLAVFDMETKAIVESFDVAHVPDVLAFDSGLERLYVACEEGPMSVFQVNGRKLTRIIEQNVGANAHTVSVDSATHLVYVPLRNVNGHPILRILKPG